MAFTSRCSPRRLLLALATGASLALASPAVTTAVAQATPALATAIGDHARKRDFSGAILVARGDSVVYHQAFGLADRALGVPVRTSSRFKAASITKAFTATLVLQLVDEGRVALDAPIGRYLPEYEGEGRDRVTVHQLLNHTSGIENFDQVKSFEEAVTKGVELHQLPHTTDQLLADHASGKLVHPPGTAFDYNNADYVILGKIVERVTGQRFDDVLRSRILAPLGLASTGMLYQRDLVPGLVPTYLRVDSAGTTIHDLPVYPENGFAASAMYSTTTDVFGFARALFGGRLLKPASLQAMLTPGLDEYGYGLWVAKVTVGGRKRRIAHRPGSIMGANTVLIRYLDDDVTVVIMANTNATDIDAFGFTIGKLVVR